MRSTLLALAALAAAAGSAGAATISTLGSENSAIFSWGLPNTGAYGQTMTFATDVELNDFSFRIDDEGTAISYLAYVFAWNGSSTADSALFSLAGSTLGNATMTTYSVATGALALTAGSYVLFFQATSAGEANWGSVTSNAYNGGLFVFQNNTGDESLFGVDPWSQNWQGPGFDLAFSATVTPTVAPVPIAASLPLLLAGIGGLGIAARRKARKSAT